MQISEFKDARLLAFHGETPVRVSYRTIPSDQISALCEYSLPFRIYGAI